MALAKDYKTMQNELNQILDDLQTGDIDVDEAIKKYDRGQVLIRDITEYLKTAKNKITKIKP
jgi:exodeoxyribonuclease VII small subunit